MIFYKSQVEQNIQISFRNMFINKVNEIIFLGLIIDDQLNWHSHIKLFFLSYTIIIML